MTKADKKILRQAAHVLAEHAGEIERGSKTDGGRWWPAAEQRRHGRAQRLSLDTLRIASQ